jgi:kinetochore protein Mis18
MELEGEHKVEESEVIAPLVFQCIGCRTIVGDSFSVVNIDASTQLVTLAAAENVQRNKGICTSKEGPDVGSTFYRFSCKSCNASLGRYYLTTSKDLDLLREHFSFEVNAVSSYQLGKCNTNQTAQQLFEEESTDDTPVASNKELMAEMTRVCSLYVTLCAHMIFAVDATCYIQFGPAGRNARRRQ